jgi:hypothetical protein
MSKATRVKVSREMTRKHLRRAERETRQRRWLFIGLGAVLLLVVGLVGYAFLNEYVIKVRQPVATVNSKNISTAYFQKRVRYARVQLTNQLAQLQAQRDQFGSDPSLSFITQQIDQQIQSVQAQLSSPTTLGKQVLDGLIEEELVRQEAAKRSLTVAPDEVQTAIEHDFNFYRVPPTPTAAPTLTPPPLVSPTPKPTAAVSITPTETPEPTETPGPTATPVTEQAYKDAFAKFMTSLQSSGMTTDDVNNLVETSLLRRKLQDDLNKSVPTSGEQVQFRTITFETWDNAQPAAEIKSPEVFDAYFKKAQAGEVVSTTVSTEPWTPVGDVSQNYGPDLASVILSLGISQTSQLITDTFGTGAVLIQQTGRGVQPYSASQLQSKQQQAYTDWLNALRNGPGINLYNSRYMEVAPTQ